MKRCHIFISGRVQGVGYRSFTMSTADSLRLKVFVHNLEEGRVEIIVEGKEKEILEFIKRLKKGPFFASVDRIEVSWEDSKNEFKDFFVMR